MRGTGFFFYDGFTPEGEKSITTATTVQHAWPADDDLCLKSFGLPGVKKSGTRSYLTTLLQMYYYLCHFWRRQVLLWDPMSKTVQKAYQGTWVHIHPGVTHCMKKRGHGGRLTVDGCIKVFMIYSRRGKGATEEDSTEYAALGVDAYVSLVPSSGTILLLCRTSSLKYLGR